MACCNNGVPVRIVDSPVDRGPGRQISLNVVRLERNRAAMCQTCTFRDLCLNGDPGDEGRKRRRDPEETCWAGRWPDEAGIVHRSIEFVGVPFPVRVRIGLMRAWKLFRHTIRENGEFTGCGCIRGMLWLKRWVPWGKGGWGRRLAKLVRVSVRDGVRVMRSVVTSLFGLRRRAARAARAASGLPRRDGAGLDGSRCGSLSCGPGGR